MPGLASLLDPGRPLEDQQPVEGAPVRPEPLQQLLQPRHRPNHQRVEPLPGQDVFGAGVEHRHGQPQPVDDLGQDAGLLGHRFGERDLQIIAHDGQHHAWHAPAGAHVEHLFLRLQELGECQAIDHVAGDELLVVGMPREIDLRIPIPEQFAIPLQQARPARPAVRFRAAQARRTGYRRGMFMAINN